MIERARDLEEALDHLDAKQRAAGDEARRLSAALADVERRVVVGEKVPAKERAS
jgi:hypothetical protein